MNYIKVFYISLLLIISSYDSLGQITVEKSGDEFQGFQKIEVRFVNALFFESSEYNFRINLTSRLIKSFPRRDDESLQWSHSLKLEPVDVGFFDDPGEEYTRLYITFEDGEKFSGIPFWFGDHFIFLGGPPTSSIYTADNLKQARDKFLSGMHFTIRLYHEMVGDSYIEFKSDRDHINNIIKYTSKLDSLSQ